MSKKLIGAQVEQQLIDRIDEHCRQANINRSTFIRQAIEQKLAETN